MRHSSFWLRYTIYFCSVVVIPLSLVLLFYAEAVRNQKNQEFQSVYSAVEQSSNIIDQYTLNMCNLVLNLQGARSVTDFLLSGKPEEDGNCITDTNEARTYLHSLNNFNVSFDNVMVYSEKSDILVTKKAAYTRLEDKYNIFTTEKITGFSDTFLKERFDKTFLYSIPLQMDGALREYLIYADTTVHMGYQKSFFVLMDTQKLILLFEQLHKGEHGFLYVADKSGNLVFSSGLPEEGMPESIKAAATEDNGFFEAKVGGARMLISYVKSKRNTFDYYLVSDMDAVLQNTQNLQMLFGSMILFAVVMTGILIAVISKRTIQPIETIVAMIQGSHAQGKYSFSDITTQLSDLVSANKTMKQALAEHLTSQKNTVFYRLFNGRFETEEEYAKGVSAIGLRTNAAWFAVVILSINDIGNTVSLAEISSIKLLINKMLDKICTSQTELSLSGYFDIDFYKETAILATSEPGRFNFCKMVNEINRRLLGELSAYSYISISLSASTTDRIGKLHFAFEEAKIALSYTQKNYDTDVLWFSRQKDSCAENDFFYPLETESRLVEAILEGDVEETKSIFSSIGRHNFEQEQLSGSAQYHLVSSMVATLYRVKQLLSKEFQDDVAEKARRLYAKLSNEKNAERVFLEIKRCSLELAMSIRGEESSRNKIMIADLVRYIDENYTDPGMCLSMVADRFSITEIYLSKLFKEQANENFSKYIEKMRMKKAQQLLLETDKKVTEISEAVGYNYVQVFNRVYKRNFACTPGEAQKRKSNDSNLK